jgi:CHASE2 domain-containing sensor protein
MTASSDRKKRHVAIAWIFNALAVSLCVVCAVTGKIVPYVPLGMMFVCISLLHLQASRKTAG